MTSGSDYRSIFDTIAYMRPVAESYRTYAELHCYCRKKSHVGSLFFPSAPRMDSS